ncbi:MAG: hypothetical protein A2046_09655 [Bacteroidetes bacterium GWA2_30_7]|nr:MAG: hypothetical protein A2046_09655 [Bacteroidetes bacterium GWA2_30_7]
MNFEKLINSIEIANTHLQQNAVKAININITLRNWLIGYYIVEFEQNGEDRAAYGTKLLSLLSKELSMKNLKNINERELRNFRTFYNTYSFFLEYLNSLPAYSQILNKIDYFPIRGTMTPELENSIHVTQKKDSEKEIWGTLTSKSQSINNKVNENYFVNLFSRIPYSHFVELIKIKDAPKRKFYELLIIKNTLSVRELERQIATLTYERVGLSKDHELAYNELENKITPTNTSDAVKSIYFFDFLNLPNSHLIEESELEDALISHLETFILELGNGFCFETRQKRILIDDEYYFVDLVFYHRILKCHILIDLKVDKFKHEHLSQLNSYVSYYKDQIKHTSDNDPIGILLCTEKGKKMVEYALAGMEEKLFVSKYLLELPSKEILSQFIEEELKKI